MRTAITYDFYYLEERMEFVWKQLNSFVEALCSTICLIDDAWGGENKILISEDLERVDISWEDDPNEGMDVKWAY